MMNKDYLPKQQDLIWIDFDPSVGKEIRKRRPAIVVSNNFYNKQTGFIAVCPITHGQKRLAKKNLLVPLSSNRIDGAINPFQLHTFDYKKRNASKIDELDDETFTQVKQYLSFIF